MFHCFDRPEFTKNLRFFVGKWLYVDTFDTGVGAAAGCGVPGTWRHLETEGGLECCAHAGREGRGGCAGVASLLFPVRRRCNTTTCIGVNIYLPEGQSYICVLFSKIKWNFPR